jgi:hypothetical protein
VVKLTINTLQTEVPVGTTILDACRKLGIYIPTLCYHPDLAPAKASASAEIIYQGERKFENARPGGGQKVAGCAWWKSRENRNWSDPVPQRQVRGW